MTMAIIVRSEHCAPKPLREYVITHAEIEPIPVEKIIEVHKYLYKEFTNLEIEFRMADL